MLARKLCHQDKSYETVTVKFIFWERNLSCKTSSLKWLQRKQLALVHSYELVICVLWKCSVAYDADVLYVVEMILFPFVVSGV